MQGVYDKSHWPCYTSDLYWALSDTCEQVAKLSNFDEDFCEYVFDHTDMPTGKYALWNFNALRDFRLGSDFPELLFKKFISMTLCIGQKALETTTETSFSTFRNQTILPFHILNEQLITIRIMFRSLNENEKALLPRKAMKFEGLLVRVIDESRPFFVAGSDQAMLTWDGTKSRVYSNHEYMSEGAEHEPSHYNRRGIQVTQNHQYNFGRNRSAHKNKFDQESSSSSDDESKFKEAAAVWHVVHNENSTSDDLWKASS